MQDMPTLTVSAPQPGAAPSVFETEGRHFDVTLDDGSVIQLQVDCGTLLVRSDCQDFRVKVGPYGEVGSFVRISLGRDGISSEGTP